MPLTIVCLSVGSFSLSHSSQNAHAYVNAAFCMSVDPSTHQVLSIANIVYGGIEEHAVSSTLSSYIYSLILLSRYM